MQTKVWRLAPEHSYDELPLLLKGQTATGMAISYYLAVRALRGEAGATLAEIQNELEISRRSLERAMPALRQAGVVVEAEKPNS